MAKRLIYAGIGSRQTPSHILTDMTALGQVLAKRGWTLRSGHAEGADKAFENGCLEARGEMEIFLPWAGFNGAWRSSYFYVPELTPSLVEIAERFHPNWAACSQGTRKLHARNVCQVLGFDLHTPATMVVCWTPKGDRSGGTGQALRIAEAYDIPIFDLAKSGQYDAMIQFIAKLLVES